MEFETNGRTDRRRELYSRRLSGRRFVTSRSDVDTARRRRSQWTLLPCVFVRPSVS